MNSTLNSQFIHLEWEVGWEGNEKRRELHKGQRKADLQVKIISWNCKKQVQACRQVFQDKTYINISKLKGKMQSLCSNARMKPHWNKTTLKSQEIWNEGSSKQSTSILLVQTRKCKRSKSISSVAEEHKMQRVTQDGWKEIQTRLSWTKMLRLHFLCKNPDLHPRVIKLEATTLNAIYSQNIPLCGKDVGRI